MGRSKLSAVSFQPSIHFDGIDAFRSGSKLDALMATVLLLDPPWDLVEPLLSVPRPRPKGGLQPAARAWEFLAHRRSTSWRRCNPTIHA
jgi:hypothetical protein